MEQTSMAVRGQLGSGPPERMTVPALMGREPECERVEQLIKRTRSGRAESVWIAGAPGSGKTALCEWVRRAAAGFQLVTVGCVEGEASLGLGAALSVIRPLQPFLTALPSMYRDTLRGVLGHSRSEPDPFVMGAATLALLAEAAARQPLLLAVDDVHWIDRVSATALAFALRRLDQDAVFTVLASRQWPEQLGFGPVEYLELDGLPLEAAMSILRRSGPIAPRVAAAVVAATGGLPLALVEVGAHLSVAQRMGEEPLPDPLPVGGRLLGTYQKHIDALPAGTRLALGTVAAAGSRRASMTPALIALGLSVEDLVPAETAGLMTLEPDGPRLVHPLIRAAALAGLDPALRRGVHATLAALATDLEERALHLVRSCSGPSADMAAELATMAARLGDERGAPAASGVWLDAARLSPPGPARLTRLQRAASELATVGRVEEAETCFAEIRSTTVDAIARAEAVIGSAWLRLFSPEATSLAEDAIMEADRIAPTSSSHALLLRCIAGAREVNCGRDPWNQLAFPIVPDPDVATFPSTFETTFPAHLLVSQNRVAEATAWLPPERIPRLIESCRRDGGINSLAGLQTAAVTLMWMERFAEAEQLVVSAIVQRRQAKRPTDLGFLLGVLGEVQWRTGRWTEAEASLSEGQTLAAQTGQRVMAAVCGAVLTRLAGAQGDHRYEQLADLILTDRSAPQSLSAGSPLHGASLFALHGLGLGHLSVGRYHDATQTLDRLEHTIHGIWLSPTLVPYQADRIEALIRAGEVVRARAAWEDFQAVARNSRSDWGIGTAARLQALLAAPDSDVDHYFDLSARALAGQPFERARTQLCWGESLRRRKEVRRSRQLLAAAADTFHELRATPWGERARAELRASGDRNANVRPPAVAALTPQELQVALTVSEGGNNREVAALLFISPKTVEYHLSRIYLKLGLRSRSELVRLITVTSSRS